jgi:hypothetical protein
MPKSIYPKYRVTAWLDTSEESMSKPVSTLVYGIQTRREKSGQWGNCATSQGPLFFNTPEQASAKCDELRKRDAK